MFGIKDHQLVLQVQGVIKLHTVFKFRICKHIAKSHFVVMT